MSFKLKGLREKRESVRVKLQRIGETIRKEERAMSAEEKSAFEQLKTDWVALGTQIQQVEADIQAIDAIASQADPGDTEPADDPPPEPAQNSRRKPGTQDRDGRPKAKGGDGADLARNRKDRALALQAWCRSQYGLGLKREHKEACQRTGLHPKARYFRFGLDRRPQRRDASVGVATAGGYTVAPEFADTLERFLKDFSGVRPVADVFRTDTGAILPYPTVDDTSNTGEIMTEGAAGTSADASFGVVNLNAYKYGTKAMLVSYELLNDSAFDLEALIAELAGERIGRAQGPHFTAGTGSGQPHGLVTRAAAGITTAGATALTASELIRLFHSVDPAYRTSPNCGYMMHDSVVAYCATLLDSTGRPLLRPYSEGFNQSVAVAQGQATLSINGKPVWVNQFMQAAAGAVLTTATVSALFGDFSKYKVRDVGEFRLRRLDERYAEKDQVGFIGFLRSDGNLINTNAVKKLTQA